MRFLIIAFVLFFGFCELSAQPVQWRGPMRDGQFPDTGLMKSWPENGPELIMEVNKIGKGYSSPVFAGDHIYTTGMIDTLDYLTSIDMNGNIRWQVPYGRSWTKSYPDTRCTPVVEENRVYVQSGTGRVVCIDADSGEEIWAVNVDEEYEGQYHSWGNSETPLLIDDKVICSPGGKKTSVVALNKMTGKPVWQTESLEGPRAYASATIYEYKDFRYILAVIGTHVIAIIPETGGIAWSYKYFNPELTGGDGLIWANTPLFKDDGIFLSMGYDYYAVMLKMDSAGTSVSEKFIDHTLDNHIGGLVYHDGYIYGSNWFNNKQGNWVCMAWDTGEIKYVTPWDKSKGSVVMADGLMYAYSERGNVGLIKPSPDGFELISEFRITKGAGPHWAHPFIKDGKLFMRHGDVLLVYDIRSR